MNEREELLQAILTDPAGDAPRLAYAELLENNGDPDMAEWIRLQLSLHHGMRVGAHAAKVRRTKLSKTILPRIEKELDPPNGLGWYARSRQDRFERLRKMSLPDLCLALVARGFISEIWCPWDYWLANHACLFWSPRQTVDTPMRNSMGGPIIGAMHRIPRPFVPTAHPIETVWLAAWPSDGHSNSGALWFVASSGSRFDRVKCDSCGGLDVQRRDGGDCPSCHGRQLNVWESVDWSGLKFKMPV